MAVLTTKCQLKYALNVKVRLRSSLDCELRLVCVGEHTMEERLAKEIMDAANNTGASEKRED